MTSSICGRVGAGAGALGDGALDVVLRHRGVLAFWTASWSAGLPSSSPPPSRAAVVIARASFVKSLPLRESTIAFLCLIDAHLEWPDMASL